MPRAARLQPGGLCYHVINRGNGRATVFHGERDYEAFALLLNKAVERLPLAIFAYCLMPNHFHLVVRPQGDGDLGRWMQWLMTSQVRRHHKRHGTDGHLWQGRFKAFPIQEDHHLLTVLRYVERNPLRAGLVARAEDWPWSSLARVGSRVAVDPSPVRKRPDWRAWVNAPQSLDELAALRLCVNRERPLGVAAWAAETAAALGLLSSFARPGRPRKGS